jgi:SAM-dependent methyltransferase
MADIANRADRDASLGTSVVHRENEYDSRSFALLRRMQAAHFWYRGRHRFLLHAVHRSVPQEGLEGRSCRVVDLGGGCGGWVEYFLAQKSFPIAEIALADSSEVALRLAADFVPPQVERRQVDLVDLQWADRWDIAFLLDVLEHLPDHERSLRQVREALAPGGLLFITVPALRQFWTWNDEFCRHQRRYDRAEIHRLATDCGFRLLDARYFMFLLSPLLLASRLASAFSPRLKSEEQRRALAMKMHAIPHPLVNGLLTAIFGMETPLGHYVRFPWGTSLLAVLQKPCEGSLVA